MGEMTFIKQGIATTIHDNGDVTSSLAVECDGCNKLQRQEGGLSITDTGKEVVLWLCSECRG